MTDEKDFSVNIKSINSPLSRDKLYPASFDGDNRYSNRWLSYEHKDGTRVIMQEEVTNTDSSSEKREFDVLFIREKGYINFKMIDYPLNDYKDSNFFIIVGDEDNKKVVYESMEKIYGKDRDYGAFIKNELLKGDLLDDYNKYIPENGGFKTMQKILNSAKDKVTCLNMNEISKNFFGR